MKTLIIMLNFICLVMSVNAASDNQNLPLNNTDNFEKVILSPKIKISQVPQNKYNIKLEYLMPYLENVMVIENPALKKDARSVGSHIRKVAHPVKDLEINSKSSRYVVSFDKKSIKMGGAQDRVLVTGLAKDNHYNYVLVKPTFSYYHPETKEYLGTEIFIIGKAKILERGHLSLLNIESAKEPIKSGTLVLPSRSLKLMENINAFNSVKKLQGYILSTIPGFVNAATNNVVVISLGLRDGVAVGQLFNIKQVDLVIQDPYQPKKKHTISRSKPKGEIVIYDVFDKLSLGFIIKSYEEIKLLDRVVSG